MSYGADFAHADPANAPLDPVIMIGADPFVWGAILLIVLAVGLIRLAWRCTKHAYILLSPIGVEVFPLFRPAATMQVIPWQQIDSAEIGRRRLTLHFTAEKSAGIHLSLSPIAKDRRELLAKAIQGRFRS